jgi:hypothetical protein
MTSSRSASTVSPWRNRPLMVGNEGSFQPSTLFLSTNHCSLRFDRRV